MGRHRVKGWLLAAPLVVAWGCSLGQGSEEGGYYDGKQEGWFWREPWFMPEALESPEQPEKSVGPPAEPQIEDGMKQSVVSPLPFSPEWMRGKLPEYRDRALQDPSPDNVRAYFYLQRYAMNMAERFALVAQKVVLADPALDENVRRPISTYGGHIFDQVARENTLRVASKVATMAGVWYFYKSDCPFCRAQNPVLERLQRRIGLVVLPIALDARAMPDGEFSRFVPNRGHAEHLDVTKTPTLYLVRKPNEFVLLSEGLVTDDGLLERIVHAGHDAQWISDAEFNSTRAAKPAEMSSPTQQVSEDILDDPIKLIEILKVRDSSAMEAVK